ncbi:S41 family peptidase [Pseudoteredinibacter isoporae]
MNSALGKGTKDLAGPPENLSDEDKLYGLSLFWKEASYNFAFFDQVPGLDFDNAYKHSISRVLATQSTYDYYRELMRLNAMLRDGHTNIYLPEGLSEKHIDWPAVELTEANRKAVVTSVDKRLQYLVPLGSTVVSVDGIAVDHYLKTTMMPYIASSTDHILWNDAVRRVLDGLPESEIKVEFKTPSGEIQEVALKRNSRGKKIEKVSLEMPSSNGELFEFKRLKDDIAYMALNGFHDEKIIEDFKKAYRDIQQAKALIIDVRFNGGGNSDIAAEILAHFAQKKLEGSTWKTRKHIAAYKAWGFYSDEYKEYAEDRAWYSGSMSSFEAKKDNHIVPTYVLTGRYTASAAEDFLIYADKLDHFTTIGEKTYGSTGQPIFFDLPGGGSFRICTKRDTYPDGREFVGYGIIPDVEIQRTPDHLRSERDIVLAKAIEGLQQRMNP